MYIKGWYYWDFRTIYEKGSSSDETKMKTCPGGCLVVCVARCCETIRRYESEIAILRENSCRKVLWDSKHEWQ
jgi:hypothetical protein